jgi:hypothetical protein
MTQQETTVQLSQQLSALLYKEPLQNGVNANLMTDGGEMSLSIKIDQHLGNI